MASLPMVARINPGGPEPLPGDETTVSFVPMAAVEAMTGRLNAGQTRPWRDVKKGYCRFQEGDVLFAKITPCMENGKVALALGLHGKAGAGSTEFHVLRPSLTLDPRLLLHYLLREDVRRQARGRMTGTAGQLRVPEAFLEEEEIPIPPAAEQRRVVDCVDSYLSRLEKVEAALERIQRNLKRYRTAILQAAVEGRLVPPEAELARAEGRDYEPASELLKRILAERRRRWEKAELARLTAAGKPAKDDKWKAKYRTPASPEVEDLPLLPEGWCWTVLDQLAWQVRDGPHYSPEYAETGVPFVTGGQVRPDGVNFDEAKRITPELHAELCKRVRPEEGDVLYTKGGTTGIARVNTYGHDFSVWVHVAVLKLAGLVEPFYVQHVLNSPWCYAQAQTYTHGVGNQDLGLTRMIKITVPLPPLAEQRRIVSELAVRDSVVGETAVGLGRRVASTNRLRQSILKWAFEGRLVDQDPNDEPASVLLERIQRERAQAGDTAVKPGKARARKAR